MADKENTLTQLAGLIGLVRRSGAMAPFLSVFILSLFPFALICLKSEKAFNQPVVFWCLLGLGVEVGLIFIIGLILAIFKTEYLLTEQHQKEMLKLQTGRKGAKNSLETELNEKDDTTSGIETKKEVAR